MTALPIAHVNDEGTVFQITVTDPAGSPKNIALATVTTVKLINPSGSSTSLAGSFVTNGSDGKFKGTTGPTTLDRTGRWHVQGYLETPDGKWHTQRQAFEVKPAA